MFVGRKGITPIELLVVIVVTTLLLAVLTPGLNRSRQLAVRLLCETNLRGIGSATAAYAGDNDGEFPKSGGPNAIWSDWGTLGPLWNRGRSEEDTFRGDPPEATVTSCLWLLVKYRYAPPKLFHCRGDSGAIAFELSKFAPSPPEVFSIAGTSAATRELIRVPSAATPIICLLLWTSSDQAMIQVT